MKCRAHSAVLLLLVLAAPASLSQPSELFELDEGTGFHQDVRLKRQSDSCQTPENKPGRCLPKKDCSEYVELAKLVDILPDAASYLRKTLCRLPGSRMRQQQQQSGQFEFGYCCDQHALDADDAEVDVKDRIVTVQQESGNHLFPATCGQSNRHHDKRLMGGAHRLAEKHAWPWLARIGYQLRPNLPMAWKCGGTLITDKHVLTAAQCLIFDPNWKVVRLGEHDLEDPNETSVKDVPIASGIIHETFLANTMKNSARRRAYIRGYDIAILVLQTTGVIQAGVISPICLPFATLHSGNSPDLKKNDVRAAGWGSSSAIWDADYRGQQSNNLPLEMRMVIVPNAECQHLYSVHRVNITDDMLCAGSPSRGKDTCQGYSGEPLMVSEMVEENERFYQVGFVSFGRGCGRVDFPGVYTRVSFFMDWIVKKVQETS